MENSESVNSSSWTSEKIASLGAADGDQFDVSEGLERLRSGVAVHEGSRRRKHWMVLGTALVGAAVATYFLRTGSTEPVSLPVPSPTVIPIAARVGSPDFRLADREGHPLQLSSFEGRVVAINFWATWCVPCRDEVPWFSQFQTEFERDGLSVLGISLDDDGWTAVRPFAAEYGINYPLALVSDTVRTAYGGIRSLPATFLVDRQGRIAMSVEGWVPRDVYERAILEVLAER